MMSKSKNQKGRIRHDITVLNIIYTVLAFVINMLMWWTIFSITRYSSLSKIIFIVVNVVVLLLMLLMNYLLFMLVRTRKVRFLNIVSGMLVIFLLISGFSTFLTTKLNVNVNKIINTGTTNENVETSIIVYSETGASPITKIDDLDGKTVGIVEGTNYATLAQEELSANGINATTKSFNDYTSIAQALFNGEIDAAALPSNYIGLLEVNDGFSDYLDNTTAISTFSKVIKVETETGSTKDITSEPFTILILGVDEGRSDAIMVASFNPISMNVTLSSLARDSYVPIACYSGKSSDKLGHARAVSRQCTIDTIEDLLDIDIDYYFESNFKGVVDMVDALGGIVVNNPIEFVGQNSSSERGHKTVWIPAGENVPLNGEMALAFARERHLYSTGDFQRQANQQQVITAILREVVRLRNVDKGVAMLEAAGENISTNMSPEQLISLFNYTMKKANRFYDKEHLEDVFNIVGSRVTGYSDGIWNEGLQLSLYIYRLYEGAIKDTREAIQRNIDMTSKITAPKDMVWSAKWEFKAPVIANEKYAEKVIQSEIPNTLPKYTTIGKLTAWAKSFNIQVNIQDITEGMEGYDPNLADGTIIWQDVPSGTAASSFTAINVKVIRKNVVTKCPANSTGEYPSCVCTDTTQKYDKNKNTCAAATTGVERNITIRYVYAENGKEAAPTYTAKVVEGNTYSVLSPAIKDYTADTATIIGTMGTSDVDVTVKYSKTAGGTPTPGTKEYTLAITYKFTDGSQAASPYSIKVKEGATYSVASPAVTDATPDIATVTGTMPSADKNVTVTYTKKVAHVHNSNGTKTISEATCDQPKMEQKYCTDDNVLQGNPYAVGSPLGHIWETKRVEPTCDQPGYTIEICKNNPSHTQNRVEIPATGGCPPPETPATTGFNFNNFNSFRELKNIAKNLLFIK